MTTRNRILALAALAAVAAPACAPTKIMISNRHVPQTNKVARSMIVPFVQNDVQMAHYYVEVCDFESLPAKNCNSTLVLENVTNFAIEK